MILVFCAWDFVLGKNGVRQTKHKVPSTKYMVILDRIALIGMLLGVSFIVQPWWSEGLRVGFFVTLIFTVLHIITSHRVSASAEDM